MIVLDPFSRNIHLGRAMAFRPDPMALARSQEAVRAGAGAVAGLVRHAAGTAFSPTPGRKR
jgi:uncharacterized protein (DUF924 family)